MKGFIIGAILIAIGAFVFLLPNEDWRSVLTTHEEIGVSIGTVGVLMAFSVVFAFVFRVLYAAFLALLAFACLASVADTAASGWSAWDLVVLVVGLALGLFAVLLAFNRLRRKGETGRSSSDELSSKAARGVTSEAFEETLSE
ncbi:MAG: hypothetical protein H6843_16550 [Rhodospirillaceae bacterium]|nr:hypothetical protein [Rhodospirillaceae bacterium]